MNFYKESVVYIFTKNAYRVAGKRAIKKVLKA